MHRRVLLLALTLTACQPAARGRVPPESATVARNVEYELRARAVRVSGEPAIHFTLTWLAAESFQLYPYELPWGNPNSLELSARNGAGEELQIFFPIADPGPQALLTLSPGSRLEGDFMLLTRVSGLSESLRTSSVVVAWRYPRPSASKRPRESASGRLTFPRGQT